jgi:hypothetical protein
MAVERTNVQPIEGRRAETFYERDARPRWEVDFRGDRVYWGPIIGGFLTALTTMALLSLLGLATGLTAVSAATQTQGATPDNAGLVSAIWAAVAAIIAFMAGGFVAARTAATYDRGWGFLNGMLVFMLALPFSLWMATVGMGAIAGGLGSFAGGLATAFGPQAADAAAQAAPTAPSQAELARAAEALRNGALGALLAGILGLLAAGLGGYLGTRSPNETASVR